DLSDQMIRRHHLIEIERVKELTLPPLSPPHHRPPPANRHPDPRNHGSTALSTRLLQHNPPIATDLVRRGIPPLCARSGCEQWRQDSPYSITSSARASSVAGTSSASALAVLRLITSSNFVGSRIGRSPGFSPLRMRPA